jgi:alpha-tubulin suppressor-like RCC1 family protein
VPLGDGYDGACLVEPGYVCVGAPSRCELLSGGYDPARARRFSARFQHGCWLSEDGARVVCWGNNFFNQARDASSAVGNLHTLHTVSAGLNHTCALDGEGAPSCWGRAEDLAGMQPADRFSDLSAGHGVTCGIIQEGAMSGTLRCWGSAPLASAPTPTGGAPYQQVSVRSQFGCVITSASDIMCWGSDPGSYGLLASPPGAFRQVSVGTNHACAVDTSGRIACWGAAFAMGSPPTDAGWAMVSASDLHAAACSAASSVARPQITSISAGRTHNCGLTTESTLSCWGSITQGAPAGAGYATVEAGHSAYQPCAITTAGDLACWGGTAMFIPAARP